MTSAARGSDSRADPNAHERAGTGAGRLRDAGPLAAYVDSLLARPVSRGAATEPAGVAASAPLAYWLVEAAGVLFALAADEAQPTDAAGAGGRRVVDLASVAVGRPAAAASPKLLALADVPGTAVAVDAVDGLVEVAPERVRWRADATRRPWLAGMLDEPRAAVVSIARLVEEV